MNNSGPRYKRSQLEKRLNTDVLWCVLLLIIMCLTAAVGAYPPWLTTRRSYFTTPALQTCPSLIIKYWEWWAALVSLCFFRSRPLAEEPQRPDLWDGYRDVSCPCWILCLLDYDHCAAGTLLTIFSQERNLNMSPSIKSERKNRKEFSNPRYITVFQTNVMWLQCPLKQCLLLLQTACFILSVTFLWTKHIWHCLFRKKKKGFALMCCFRYRWDNATYVHVTDSDVCYSKLPQWYIIT